MSNIVTYPLDGITYDATDAAGYCATRQSGVYSAEDCFTVSPADGTSVTVGAGIAWVHPERWVGYSIIQREDATLELPVADSTRPRIDRVVLRYDAAARKTTLQVLQGTADSQPTAPAVTRTALIYDLCLAEIRRPAASTAVTAADITDTRTDEDVCGVMRDGVTGIPTAQLLAQWQAVQSRQEQDARASTEALVQQLQTDTGKVLDDTRQQAADLLASYTAGYLGTYTLTLAANSWQAAAGSYPLQYTVSVPLCRVVHIPVATLAPDSIAAGTAAGIAGSCETLDGSVRFFAAQRPAADLTLQLVLLGPKGDA